MGKQKGGRAKGIDVTKDFVTGSHSLSETITVFVENNKPINVTEKELIATVGSEGVFALRRGGKLDAYMKLCTNWHQGQCHNNEQCSFAHVKDFFGLAPPVSMQQMLMTMMPPIVGGNGVPMLFPSTNNMPQNGPTTSLSGGGGATSASAMFQQQQQQQQRAWAPAALTPESNAVGSQYKSNSAWGVGHAQPATSDPHMDLQSSNGGVAGISVWGVGGNGGLPTASAESDSATTSSLWSVLAGDNTPINGKPIPTAPAASSSSAAAAASHHSPWVASNSHSYTASSALGMGGVAGGGAGHSGGFPQAQFSDLSANSPPFQPASAVLGGGGSGGSHDPLAAFLSLSGHDVISPAKLQQQQVTPPLRGGGLWSDASSSSSPHATFHMLQPPQHPLASTEPKTGYHQSNTANGASSLYACFPGLVSDPSSQGLSSSLPRGVGGSSSGLVGSGVLSSAMLDGSSPVASVGGSPTTTTEPGNAQLSHLMSLLTAGM